MKKLGIIFILIILISSNVYSLSLFPKDNKDNNLVSLNVAELKEVHYDKENTLELVLESNSNLKIDGIKVNINNNDNIIVNEQLYPYSTKIYQINTKETPDIIQIQFYNDNKHNRNIFNQDITYRITGNEKNIIQQPEQIVIQENQQLQLQFNQRPSYISYTSYSKLDDNKNIIYFTKDLINSNQISTNQQGNIEFQANYQPYGKVFKEEGKESYKFSNKELDSSNLYYFGARYYDPSIGRFTQVDPIFKSSESPYMYANNNPIKYVDPNGMGPELVVISTIDLADDVANMVGDRAPNSYISEVVHGPTDIGEALARNTGSAKTVVINLHGTPKTVQSRFGDWSMKRSELIKLLKKAGVENVVDGSCWATCNVDDYSKAGINAVAIFGESFNLYTTKGTKGFVRHGKVHAGDKRAAFLLDFLSESAQNNVKTSNMGGFGSMEGFGFRYVQAAKPSIFSRLFRSGRAGAVGLALSAALAQPSNAEELAGSMATTSIAFIPGMGPVLAGVFGIDSSNSYSQTERWQDENPSWIWQDEVSVSARAGYGRDEGRRW